MRGWPSAIVWDGLLAGFCAGEVAMLWQRIISFIFS